MMHPPELIDQREVFQRLLTQCDTLFNRTKRLPDFVFRSNFATYRAFEYANLHTEKFGRFLANVATASGDTQVHFMTIDPDPAEHFDNHGYFGAASFDALTIGEKYKHVMSSINPNDAKRSFVIYANIGVFWGSSATWAMFCDRSSWELCVIALTNHKVIPSDSDIRFLDQVTLSSYMHSQYHWKNDTAVDFTKTFLANYSK